MAKNITFDFCIIPNPFASKGRYIVFVTSSGDNFLNEKIMNNKEYQEVREILGHFGYTETNSLRFESSSNSDSDESNVAELKEFLEGYGLTYSRELEVNIIRDIGKMKDEGDRVAQNNLDFIYGDGTLESMPDIPIGESTKNELIISKDKLFDFKYEVPEFREKITLNFYLFLEFGFNEKGSPTMQFGGGFDDSEDMDHKNYIRIVKSEFERVRDKRSPNSIILRSVKTQEDFIKEIGMLYGGYFRYQRRVMKGESIVTQDKKFNYKIVDVKRFLKPEQAIVIQSNRMSYDRLINLSNKIGVESLTESKRWISTGDIEFEAIELKDLMTSKMEILSQEEDYEEAARMKKDVDYISDRIEFVQNLDRTEITTEEYFEMFSLT